MIGLHGTLMNALILQHYKTLTFASVCLVCTVCSVLRHITPQAVSVSGQSKMVSPLFYNVLFLPMRAV